MHDLNGAYERLKEVYRLYIKSAFPLRNRVLSAEREELLRQPGILSQPPLLEPLPIYPSSGKTLKQAALSLPSQYQDLQYVGQTLFGPELKITSTSGKAWKQR